MNESTQTHPTSPSWIRSALWLLFFTPSLLFATTIDLVITGDLKGELEPCGCSEAGDFGGIRRQATLLKQLRNELAEPIIISTGNLFSADMAIDKIKNRYILSGLAAHRYDAIGLRWQDLEFGSEFLRQESLPLVASNWRGDTFLHERLIGRSGAQVAYLQWLSPERSPYRIMQGDHTPIDSALASLTSRVATLREQGHLIIIASDATAPDAGLMAIAPDLLLLAALDEYPRTPNRIGNTLVIQPGSRGQRFTHLRLDLATAGPLITSWQQRVLPMPEGMVEEPALDSWYAAYSAELKTDYLRRVALRKTSEQGGSDYLGEQVCQGCHNAAYATWLATPHAKALERLEEVSKTFDPGCLGCHTVAFLQPGGFLDQSLTPHLTGVQCESCHGGGRAHVAAAGMSRTVTAGQPLASYCSGCHHRDHSPLFVLEQYWERIRH